MRKLFALPAIASSIIVTVLLFGVQRFGVFQSLELRVLDQMMQIRANSESDSRLLIVGVNEEDIKQLQQVPLSDEVINNLLVKLIEYEPRAIGLDIFRDIPIDPGHDQLLETLQLDDLIVPICKHPDSTTSAVSPPPGIENPELRVGFNDVVEDTDGIIRRNLLLRQASEDCPTEHSFGLQLALKYLEAENIQPQFDTRGELQIRNVKFKPLTSNSGAYHNMDAGGEQILLNYRHFNQVAQQVSATDILTNKVSPELVKNRVVLIGYTAPSLKDIFKTPYSSGKSDLSGDMAGVEIHANSVSQILSAVLDGQRLYWFLPEWGEVVWILLWSLAGGVIGFRLRHPVLLGIAGVGTVAILFVGNLFIFTQSGWIPVVTPALGSILAAVSAIAYNGYQSKQDEETIKQNLEDQKEAIHQLQALLRQKNTTSSQNSLGESSDTTEILVPLGVEISPNTLLNHRYKVTKKLALGGFGLTYLAEDIQRPGNPICVVKQLRPARSDQQFLNIAKRLFKTEAENLELLGRRHNQIPLLLAYFEENHQFYLVQEYIEGQPLDKEIVPGTRWEETQVLKFLKEVLQILVFVHGHGVIHRDIKPGNLIRQKSDGRIVLIDFGAVKVIQNPEEEIQGFEQQENHTIAIGSRGYAPTEQIDGLPEFSSDLYALGITAIQALIGIDPRKYRRDSSTATLITASQSNESLQYWRELVNISEKFAAILDRMVHYDSNQRYHSAIEVLKSLESL